MADYDDGGGPPARLDGADEGGPSLANIEAEAAFLGGAMIDNRIIEDTMMVLQQTDFFEPVHGRIYRVMLAKSANGETANPVTLRPIFENDPDLGQLGGVGYLSQLTQGAAVIAGAQDFAKQIAELARLRVLRDGALEFLRDLGALDERSTVAGFIGQLEAVTARVLTDEAHTDSFSAAEAIDRVINTIVAIQEGKNPPGMTLDGLADLVKLIGAFVPKHLQVWAARPGMGKSALMLSTALAGARAGFGVGIISLEMGDVDIGQRLAADVCQFNGEAIKHSHIRDAKLSIDELRQLANAAGDIREWPLQIVETAGITISRVGTIMRRMKRVAEAKGQKLHTVFVDYLQLILPDISTGNRASDMTGVSNALKRYAKELDITVVALSQLNREVEKREDKRPQLSDLRESGALEQDADLVLFLYREEYYLESREPDAARMPEAHIKWQQAMDAVRDKLEVIVAKRRDGSTGRRMLLFLRQYQAVRDHDWFELARFGR